MKIFVLGRQGSITHWLEDAVAAFRREGHDVAVGLTRRPWLNAAFEVALAAPIADRIARRVTRFDPEMILVVGAYHIPAAMLDAVARLASRAPLVGWVGDTFDGSVAWAADCYDLLAYTDSGLLARHETLAFGAQGLFLPHAVDPGAYEAPMSATERLARMVFIGNPTDHRRAVVGALTSPIALYGPAWTPVAAVDHEIHAHRIAKRRAFALYASHIAALNIRNERNVLSGLNQRNFEPCLGGAAVVTDHQPDLERCFDPAREVLAWRTTDDLNALYFKVLENPAWAATVGEAGRRRVLTEHTYAVRLQILRAAL